MKAVFTKLPYFAPALRGELLCSPALTDVNLPTIAWWVNICMLSTMIEVLLCLCAKFRFALEFVSLCFEWLSERRLSLFIYSFVRSFVHPFFFVKPLTSSLLSLFLSTFLCLCVKKRQTNWWQERRKSYKATENSINILIGQQLNSQ